MPFWRPFLREAWETGMVFVQFCCFINVFSNHVLEIQQSIGPSMLPTLNPAGDVLLLEHVLTRFRKIKPGDVVMAVSPEKPRKTVCKRVLGMEGDQITVMPAPNSKDRVRHVVVPRGHVWLQGDNYYHSNDSRHYGPVPYALLQGRVFYRIWPLDEWGPVPSYP